MKLFLVPVTLFERCDLLGVPGRNVEVGHGVCSQNIKSFVYVVVDIWIHDSSNLVASHLTKSEQSGQNFYYREKFLIIEKWIKWREWFQNSVSKWTNLLSWALSYNPGIYFVFCCFFFEIKMRCWTRHLWKQETVWPAILSLHASGA